MKIISRIEPQPPLGIKYMIGGESWLAQEERTETRLCCEEWGNLGPLVLDSSIKPNLSGLRVKLTHIPAPEGANGYTRVNGIYYWTAENMFELISARLFPPRLLGKDDRE